MCMCVVTLEILEMALGSDASNLHSVSFSSLIILSKLREPKLATGLLALFPGLHVPSWEQSTCGKC